MTTHDINDVLDGFDQIIFMRNGEIIKSGSYSEMQNTNEFIEFKEGCN